MHLNLISSAKCRRSEFVPEVARVAFESTEMKVGVGGSSRRVLLTLFDTGDLFVEGKTIECHNVPKLDHSIPHTRRFLLFPLITNTIPMAAP